LKEFSTPQSIHHHIALMRKARPKNLYTVKVLDYTFFKNYDNLSTLTSIRPRSKKGNKVISDIVYLKYVKNGDIYFRTDFDNEWETLLQKQLRSKNQLKIL